MPLGSVRLNAATKFGLAAKGAGSRVGGMKWLRAVTMPAIVLLSASHSARAACPDNTISVVPGYGGPSHTTSAPSDSISQYASGSVCDYGYCYYYYAYGEAVYDLKAGTVRVHAYANSYGYGQASAATGDVFTLLGPPSDPPITFHARAHVDFPGDCSYGTEGGADATIREGASNSAMANHQTCQHAATDIEVAMTRAAGSTFDLSFILNASGGSGDGYYGGNGGVSVALSFPDLPSGYSVVSCQGFASGKVTATRPLSWGELKARYR